VRSMAQFENVIGPVKPPPEVIAMRLENVHWFTVTFSAPSLPD